MRRSERVECVRGDVDVDVVRDAELEQFAMGAGQRVRLGHGVEVGSAQPRLLPQRDVSSLLRLGTRP